MRTLRLPLPPSSRKMCGSPSTPPSARSRVIGLVPTFLEITTCGAVAPYNRVLGGKLVALLLLSPQVAADNNRRYGREPTIIRSQLKNTRVVPDSTLVWLGTTSLFSHGSSQYQRLHLPAGIIAAGPARNPLHLSRKHDGLRYRPVCGRYCARPRKVCCGAGAATGTSTASLAKARARACAS